MKSAGPILTILLAILVLWYGAAVWMNAQWTYDQAARAGTTVTLGQVVADTMVQDRPVLPAPHQVAAEMWKGLTAQKVTSKRSLVYHGYVTLTATFWGFAMGLGLGILMAVGIVHSRTLDRSLMPWAIISQTIPIVDKRLVSKTIIAAYLSYFPVLVGMIKGLRSPDRMQLDLLDTYGASRGQTFWKLRLPASMPYLFASLKVAVAASLVGAIVGELPTGAVEGLGARMLVGSQFGAPRIMWAARFAAALLAGALILAVGQLERLANRRMGVRE